MTQEENIEAYVLDLLKRTGHDINTSEAMSNESIEVYCEELDDRLLPDNMDEIIVPNQLIRHVYDVASYQVYILADSDDYKWYLVGILHDNKLFYYEIPDYSDE